MMHARFYSPPFGNWPRRQVQVPSHRIWSPGLPLSAPTYRPNKQQQICNRGSLSISRIDLEPPDGVALALLSVE